jgi:hypothetical protein
VPTRASRALVCCALLAWTWLGGASTSAGAAEPVRDQSNLCRPPATSGATWAIHQAFDRERACLEQALGQQRRQAQSRLSRSSPRAAAPKVSLLQAQEPALKELNELMCRLDEDLSWISFGGRWRDDGTMRGTLYGECITGALREQIYFGEMLMRSRAADAHALALDVSSHAPYVRGMLVDVDKAASDLLAQKLPPGPREQFFTGSPLGPSDWLELSATARRAQRLAAQLGRGACQAWPELERTFADEQTCQTVMSDYYVAVTGLLNFGKQFERISL